MMTDLIPIETIDAAEVFTGDALDTLLARIKEHATNFSADSSTEAGRKEIKSMAYKVARSKTAIDDAGKSIVEDWKNKAKAVDAQRKHARDFLDELRDQIRRPVTEWEEEQKRIEREAAEAERKAKEEAERARLAEIEAREREAREREAELRRREEELRQREREAAIRKEAEERAKAEQAAALERAERQRIEAIERAERERIAAIERERQERERQEQERERAIKAENERVRREFEEAEARKARAAEAERLEKERAAADQKNRDDIHSKIYIALGAHGIGDRTAIKLINLLANGDVPRVSIDYSRNIAEPNE